MYEEIRNLAVEAVKLQNKLNMESTLNRIAELCDSACSTESEASGDNALKKMLWPAIHELYGHAYVAECKAQADETPPEFLDALMYNVAKNWPAEDLIAAGDVLVAADGQEFKVDAVIAPKKSRAKVAK